MSTVQQFWFVFPLILNETEARPDRRLRLDEWNASQEEGSSSMIRISNLHREDMMRAFTSLSAAQEWARKVAESHPRTMYGVYECREIFETLTPPLVMKSFNNAGELVPV